MARIQYISWMVLVQIKTEAIYECAMATIASTNVAFITGSKWYPKLH